MPSNPVHKELVQFQGEPTRHDIADYGFLMATWPTESHVSPLVSGYSCSFKGMTLPALLVFLPPHCYLYVMPSVLVNTGAYMLISYFLFAKIAI